MPLPIIAGAAIGAAGSILAGGLNYFGQKSANRANIASARESMDFQERMSGTSYQRSMEDMRKAGLNPILAAGRGGASTPGGAQALAQNEMSGAVSSALEVKRLQADLQLIRENAALAAVNQKAVIADMQNKNLATASQIGTNYWDQIYKSALARNVDADTIMKTIEADISQTTFGTAMRYASKIPGLSSILSSAGGNLFKKAPNIFKGGPTFNKIYK